MRSILKWLTILSFVMVLAVTSLALAWQLPIAPRGAEGAAWPSAMFGPPRPVEGYSIINSVALHRDPRQRSPVVATLKNVSPYGFDDPLEFSGVSGAFVHVQHKGIKGWANMREALPHTVAFVLDAKTGATIARVPVGAGQKDITFSPDGSRAVVYGPTPTGLHAAYEYRTRDFAPTRTITANGGGKPAEVRAIFYGGSAQALYAVVQDKAGVYSSDFAIVRVQEKGAPAEPPVLRDSGIDFVTSPDRRLGFVLRSVDSDFGGHVREATIAVLDLRKLTLRNTITLTGELASAFLDQIIPSFDGSEIYLLGDVSHLHVLDTATGKEVRQVRTGWEPNRELFLRNLCSGGHSLLIEAAGDVCEVLAPEGALWITDNLAVPAPIATFATDTGKSRYGVENGTLLYLFDRGGKVVRKTMIWQPNLYGTRQTINKMSLTASPNGSRLVLFVSYGEEFCPC